MKKTEQMIIYKRVCLLRIITVLCTSGFRRRGLRRKRVGNLPRAIFFSLSLSLDDERYFIYIFPTKPTELAAPLTFTCICEAHNIAYPISTDVRAGIFEFFFNKARCTCEARRVDLIIRRATKE